MNIDQFVKSYFNGFTQISHFNENKKRTNALAIIKIISYFTVVIPLFVCSLQLLSLQGRVHKKEGLSPLDKKVDAQKEKIFRPATPPTESPVHSRVQESLKRSQQTRKEFEALLAEIEAERQKPIEMPKQEPAQVVFVSMMEEMKPEIIEKLRGDCQELIDLAKKRWALALPLHQYVFAVWTAAQDPKAFYLNPDAEIPLKIHSNQVLEYSGKFQQRYLECIQVMEALEAGVKECATTEEAAAELQRIRALTAPVTHLFNLITPMAQIFRTSFEPVLEGWLKNVQVHVRNAMVGYCNQFTQSRAQTTQVMYK